MKCKLPFCLPSLVHDGCFLTDHPLQQAPCFTFLTSLIDSNWLKDPWLQQKIQKIPNNNKWLAHSSHLVDCPGFNPGVLRCIITPPITEVLSASNIDLTSNTSRSLYAILLLNPLHSQKPLFFSVSKNLSRRWCLLRTLTITATTRTLQPLNPSAPSSSSSFLIT